MYDARNEAHEFTATTRAEAIRKATDFFGVGVEELRVGGFKEGEVYGLGGRTVVVASLRNRTQPVGRDGGADGGRGDRPRRGGREDRPRERGGREDRPRERGGRGSERGEGRGEGRSEGRNDARGERSSERGARDLDRDEERVAPVAIAAAAPDEPSVGTVRGEVGEVGRFLVGAIERMDIGPFAISENSEGEVLAYEVSGAAAEVLASGEGRTVDALQVLANQVAQRLEIDSRVVVDVEGNADAREDLLTRLASRAASRARKGGRAVALDPMNGRDRRAIHIALRDEDGVATMSVGEGRYRQVVIVPEGAPEYEQAHRESSAAPPDGNR